jgi:hypothetical protein
MVLCRTIQGLENTCKKTRKLGTEQNLMKVFNISLMFGPFMSGKIINTCLFFLAIYSETIILKIKSVEIKLF